MSTAAMLGIVAVMFLPVLWRMARRGPVPPPLPDLGRGESTLSLLPSGAIQRKGREAP